MATVLVNHLRVRTGPSVNTPEVAHYDAGQRINSVLGTVENEGRTWLKYRGASGNERFVCLRDINGDIYIKYGKDDSGWKLTAYCSCVQCCGKSDGITASGYHLTSSDHLKICAAPKNIPFHTVIHITGGWNGIVKVEDRGGAIKGKRLDIYCRTHQEALQFGVKNNCTLSY